MSRTKGAKDTKPRRRRRAGGKGGPGRPKGVQNMLPYGYREALKTSNYRVPPGTPPELCGVANEALCRIYDVMNEGVVHQLATPVLKSAKEIRAEICSPLTQKHELDAGVTIIVRTGIDAPPGSKVA